MRPQEYSVADVGSANAGAPPRAPADESTIAALSSLGHRYALTGDVNRRAQIQRELHARSPRRWGADNQYTLVEQVNLGEAELDVGRAEVARRHLECAVAGLIVTSGENSNLVDTARYSLATVLHELGRHADVLALINQIDAARIAAGSSDSRGDGKLAALRGQALIAMGRLDEGKTVLVQALQVLTAEGRDEAELAPLRAVLGRADARGGR